MHILQLCHKPPVPAVDGGCIAMVAASKALLHAGHSVKTLAIETHKHPFQPKGNDEAYIGKTGLETFFVNTRINFLMAFFNLLSKRPYQVARFWNKGFNKAIVKSLSEKPYDVVQLESLFVAPYIPIIRRYAPGAKIVLRAHNLEHLVWERTAANAAFPKSAYLRFLARKMKNYECNIFKAVDGIIAISEGDATRIKSLAPGLPVTGIPVNVDVENGVPEPNNKLFYIGAFDWLPNSIGVDWFLKEVWPEALKKSNGVSFHIAGRKMHDHIWPARHKAVVAHGEVPDARAFMKDYGIMVVPLFSGSGIRVKILEAMALGKTVISTSVGAEGLGLAHEREVLIADTAGEFVDAIEKCAGNPAFVAEIGHNARNFVKENFSTEKLGKAFSQFFVSIQG